MRLTPVLEYYDIATEQELDDDEEHRDSNNQNSKESPATVFSMTDKMLQHVTISTSRSTSGSCADDDNSSSFLSYDTPLADLYRVTQPWTKLDPKGSSLMRVPVVESRSGPSERKNNDDNDDNERAAFAVILSISHLVADIHTFYLIHDMLLLSDCPPFALDLSSPPNEDNRVRQ